MNINWQDVIVTIGTTVGGSAVLLAGAAWLIQTVLTNKLTRDLETFKARLKADGDIEIERLKSSLQKIAFEDQVRFSKLHEKRAEIIAEIYARMVDVEHRGKQFIFVEGFGKDEQKRRDAYSETGKKLLEFFFFTEKHRIYLPERICDSLAAFDDILRSSINGINIFVPVTFDAATGDEIRKQRAKALTDAVEACEKKIPDARLALEQEFRHILGVERDAKSE